MMVALAVMIRAATTDDAGQIADLLRELGYQQDGDPRDRLRRWADGRWPRPSGASSTWPLRAFGPSGFPCLGSGCAAAERCVS